MSIKTIVRSYVALIRPRAQGELNWFRQQPTLQSAIEYAALAINRRGKRYRHQTRFQKRTLEQAKQILLAYATMIEESKSFDDLFTFIDTVLGPN